MCSLQFHASCIDTTLNTVNWNQVFVPTVYVLLDSIVYVRNKHSM